LLIARAFVEFTSEPAEADPLLEVQQTAFSAGLNWHLAFYTKQRSGRRAVNQVRSDLTTPLESF